MAGAHVWDKNGEGRAVGSSSKGETEGVCPEKDNRKTDVIGEKSEDWLMKG